jgi:hypothetical protein
VVIFASAGASDYFKAIQLAAPIQRNNLHVSAYPHLYPHLLAPVGGAGAFLRYQI